MKKKFKYKSQTLTFDKVNIHEFPVYKIFKKINKQNPKNFIKFNCANQMAVELFKNGKISYIKIPKFINKAMKLSSNYPVNTIKNVIKFQDNFNLKLNSFYEK